MLITSTDKCGQPGTHIDQMNSLTRANVHHEENDRNLIIPGRDLPCRHCCIKANTFQYAFGFPQIGPDACMDSSTLRHALRGQGTLLHVCCEAPVSEAC